MPNISTPESAACDSKKLHIAREIKVANQSTKAGSSRGDSATPTTGARSEKRCKRCSETRYNSRACQVELEGVDDSEESK
ncbi:hypothetical protein COCC4DRAFT_155245 [Bipolaris maydis ATCC 48331]|uniref:Uncharacterized protein n=1 Tax=Cochliobolus heterostrophus (strain C4 / ATCC 48331 / race T) TaxID=665024 RepID=N4X0A4_COCH4|nr:uncharacterized protein COCC4DRAFT_155245 [Bipolaris maydis ATCC 48331]ENH98656.1 hypothetical protein COCC4DRAFT_155245 [Bipolaris maydis ATCC 48331]